MTARNISQRRRFVNILCALECFSSPSTTFMQYEFCKMYAIHRNYLESSCKFLESVDFGNFLETHALQYKLPMPIFEKLKDIKKLSDVFYNTARELGDFDVVRRKEWDELIPLAQECYVALEKIYIKGTIKH